MDWRLHENGEWLLQTLGRDVDCVTHPHLLLACDGSAPSGLQTDTSMLAAWAVVIGAFSDTSDSFNQADGGFVCTGALSGRCHHMQHGLSENNILAEAMAVLFALFFIISRPWVTSAEIISDCDPIRLLLQRSAMLDDLGPFGHLIVGVYEFACATKHVVIRHTHAHKGQPWNELADSLAGAAALATLTLPPDDRWSSIIPTSADAWAWIQHPALPSSTQFPCVRDNCFVVSPQKVAFTPVNVVQYKDVSAQSVTAKSLSLVSFNTCTLGCTSGDNTSKFWLDKAPILATQFEPFRLVGIQEARTPRGDSLLISQSSVWYRIAGGKTLNSIGCSNLGVELWINLALPFAQVRGKPAYFKKDDATILYCHPRLLIVRITNKHIDLFTFVAHAPHTASKPHDRASFWNMLSKYTEGE